jgi:hypothetical protein
MKRILYTLYMYTHDLGSCHFALKLARSIGDKFMYVVIMAGLSAALVQTSVLKNVGTNTNMYKYENNKPKSHLIYLHPQSCDNSAFILRPLLYNPINHSPDGPGKLGVQCLCGFRRLIRVVGRNIPDRKHESLI